MPANRPHQDRAAKAAAILDAAEPLFLNSGYEATTMAMVAAAAGISPNAVYWYFPGKDDLLAAILRRRQKNALTQLDARSGASFETQVKAVLAELDSVAGLTATVHERAEHSEAVADAHRAFHSGVDAQLRHGFEAAGLSEDDARRASAALIAAVEGIHLHSPTRDAAERDELILWLLGRLAGS
jgi:AcrR family transcriptional regulator